MKNIIYTLLAFLMIFAISTYSVNAQSEVKREVSGFNGIILDDPFTLIVTIGETESVKISTDSISDSDVIALIETKVKNGVLEVKYKDDLKEGQGNTKGLIRVYITAKSLSSIVNNASGSIKLEGTVTGNSINIAANGSGGIEASIKSPVLNTVISGSGSVSLGGNTDKAKITINGTGSLNARELKTLDAAVMINGVGSAYFQADRSVSAHVTGVGSVTYSGNAVITPGSNGINKAD